MIVDNILKTTGNTPLVKIRPLANSTSNLYLKLEWFGMGGSTKDRIALSMVEDAEKSGHLKPGMNIIESSSGNTAIGLAIISAQRDYNFFAICDQHLPIGKRNRLKALGANIVFIPPTPEGLDTVEMRIKMARSLAKAIPNSTTLEQYANPANSDAHYKGTGPEIWRDTDGKIDACVIFCGTCGSVSGIGRYLKEKNPKIQIIAVEPVGSAIFGGPLHSYLIAGGGLSFVPEILDKTVIDRIVRVTDEDAFKNARDLAVSEGIMVGSSGGGVLSVARKLAAEFGAEKSIVAVMPDIGDRYIDSLYDKKWLHDHNLSHIIEPKSLHPIIVNAVKSVGCILNEIN